MDDLQTALDNWRKGRQFDARPTATDRSGKRPVGRPRFPRGKAKQAVLQVRLTESEINRIKRASESDGQELSSWVRDVLLRFAR